jgi:outer membrane protein assembly factor BamD (BamD/ComL family)
MTGQRISLSCLLCCAALLVACSSPKFEWSQANAMNTIGAYRTFLSKYPNDVHAGDAKIRIAALQDEQAWSTAQVASSVQGYQQYLSVEPNGAHVPAAREEVARRERLAAWRTAQTNETAQSLEEFLQKYPAGDEADQARDKLKMIAGYRAELAMVRSRGLADRERDALAKRFGKALQQVVVLGPDGNSRDYRITSARMSETDANAACATVKHAGQSCKVIQASG